MLECLLWLLCDFGVKISPYPSHRNGCSSSFLLLLILKPVHTTKLELFTSVSRETFRGTYDFFFQPKHLTAFNKLINSVHLEIRRP